MKTEQPSSPNFAYALVILLQVLMIVGCGVVFFDGNIQILLLSALCSTSILVLPYTQGYCFEPIRYAINEGIRASLPALSIFILIGVMIAAFIQAGTVPALVHYGLMLISIKWFLPAAFLLCCLTSLATGSSWSTISTIGIVLIGMAETLGLNQAIVAGAIVSGASLGDKLSPVSDTTNLAATAVGIDLFSHIKGMLPTLLVAFCGALLIFTFWGLNLKAENIHTLVKITELNQSISAQFTINWLCLLPIGIMFSLNMMRISSEPAMVASIISAVVVALCVQKRAFSTILNALVVGQKSNSGVAVIDSIISKGGIYAMTETLTIALMALALGGILHHFKILKVLSNAIAKHVQNGRKLIGITFISTFLSLVAMGEAYIAIIISGRTFKKHYQKLQIEPMVLSRTLEDGATLMAPLVPWATGGVFIANTLGVSVTDYAPYAVFNWMSPIISILLVGLFVSSKCSSASYEWRYH